ncbi:hypothetical protein P154DRAFT_517253 [Amniculicola lignicola CBS 123094]|uniref:Uncharacterized protein n=1 Tax=Amniculicola lignicola CBS 123094 TaxID=1392246 RepID=A0A6A5X3W1_9PLEO|nr:hypothetical protein P154DRAFT_517253 [Amniculicola lignicola CBS 123094]
MPRIQAPKLCNGGVITKSTCALGSKFFSGAVDRPVCASFASAQTTANTNAIRKGEQYLPCNFLNASLLFGSIRWNDD